VFDVGLQELVLLAVIGLLILGPERLPRVAAQLGRWVGRARRTAAQLRHQLEREIALSELAKTQAQNKEEDAERRKRAEEAEARQAAAAGGDEAAAAEGPSGDESPASEPKAGADGEAAPAAQHESDQAADQRHVP
jgi:sec-independent protein translocase protein TatB